jgi:molybdopterin-guanine dinucleotide biosynthesis protein MobB
MIPPDAPPVVSIIGRKNSGKTMLVVALASALKRRGLRVGSMKHGHHSFDIDHRGRDSWRHFHEGEVEAVLVASSDKLALIERTDGPDVDPRALIDRFFSGRGLDIVLVEGFKHGPFPRIEVFRGAIHASPLLRESTEEERSAWLAIVSDRPLERATVPVLLVDRSGAHIDGLVELLLRDLLAPGAG